MDQKGICVVGFYDPNGQWIPESDHFEIFSAAARVHYLNGGVDAELIGQVVGHIADLIVKTNDSLVDLREVISHDQN